MLRPSLWLRKNIDCGAGASAANQMRCRRRTQNRQAVGEQSRIDGVSTILVAKDLCNLAWR
jgi:hypothetical protein